MGKPVLSDHLPTEVLEGELEEARRAHRVVRRRLSQLEAEHLDESMADRAERSSALMGIVRDELLLLDAVAETLEVRLGRREEVSVELPRPLEKRLGEELEEIARRRVRFTMTRR